jgi:ATP-binding cassette subfamily B multidrug efflux pump
MSEPPPARPRLAALLRPYAPRLALGVAAALAASLCFFATPLVIRDSVAALEAGGTDPAARPAVLAALVRSAGLLLALALARGVFNYFTRWWTVGASRSVERDLRNALFAHLQALPPSFYDRTRSGDLLSRAVNDVEGVRVMIAIGFLQGAGTQSLALFCVAGMLWISPTLTLLALLPLLVGALALRRMGDWVHRLSTGVQEQLSALSARAQESFAGARVIRAYAQEANEEAAFDALSRGALERNLRLARAQGLVNATLAVLGEAGVAVLIAAGGPAVAGREIALGDFVAFTAYQFMLVWPMIALGWILGVVQRGRACWTRIDEVFAERADIADPGPGSDVPGPGSPPPRIEIDRLTFAYEGGPPVLRDVSFTVEPGQWVAIVGRTGSGKSTIAHLLARFYPVPRGMIHWDGTDLSDLPVRPLRDALGYVPQETFLFSEPLRENIRFGDPGLTEDAVHRAARVAHLLGDIETFPERLGQRVGERGVTLSGGQRQRTALARVVARDPRLVVLDDVFSSVDAQTEAAILGELRGFLRGRTTIQIAHRLASVRGADRILVLDDGCLVESGTHAELMRRDGPYAAMARQQELESRLAAS